MKTLFRYFTGCLISLLVCLTAMPSLAAVAVQSTTDGPTTLSATTNTTSLTVSAGSDLVVVACVNSSGGAGVDATAIQYNAAENFSKIGVATRVWNGINEAYAAMWYLVNPTVTTANAVVTFPSTANDRTQRVTYLVLTGAAQTGTVDIHGGNNGTGTTATVSMDTVTANALLIDCAFGDHVDGLTVDGTQTMRMDNVPSGQSNGSGVSTKATTTPGTQSMTWTQTSAEWNIYAAAINEVQAVASTGVSGCGAAMILLGKGAGC